MGFRVEGLGFRVEGFVRGFCAGLGGLGFRVFFRFFFEAFSISLVGLHLFKGSIVIYRGFI